MFGRIRFKKENSMGYLDGIMFIIILLIVMKCKNNNEIFDRNYTNTLRGGNGWYNFTSYS